MAFAVDLHIHSCLSPCGDEEMTPGNIAGMAYLKGLDAIALTDHNGWQNLPAMEKTCAAYGVVLLPGLEVTTREEVHMLCYFPSVEEACAFGRLVQEHLPAVENIPTLFGEQQIRNEDDEVTGVYGKLLLQATDIGTDDLPALCMEMGGVCVPAHINRKANSLIANLGFLSLNEPYAAVEVYKKLPNPTDTGEYLILHSSDAHQLGDISEREFFLRFEEKSTKSLFDYLKAHIGCG